MAYKDIYSFIHAYKMKHPEGHYFDRDTLKFWKERVSDMKVLKETETVTDILGNKHVCYVISSLYRGEPGRPKKKYAYFDVETLKHVAV